jgi:hypothetical protein
MDFFSAIVLVMLGWLACLLAVRREVQRMRAACRSAPRGPVTDPERLEERREPIGRYAGREIYASVTFAGQRYHFAGVAPARYRDQLRPRELFVEPGLVYTEDN